jgi:hypothetical protein
MKSTFLLLCLTLLTLLGCASASDPNVEQTEQPLIVPLVMHVRNDTLQMVAPKGRLSESTTDPTPNLTQVTVVIPSGSCTLAGGIGTYSVTTAQAIVCVTSAQFNAINAELAQEPTHHIDVDLSYDNSGTLSNKPVTSVSFPLI